MNSFDLQIEIDAPAEVVFAVISRRAAARPLATPAGPRSARSNETGPADEPRSRQQATTAALIAVTDVSAPDTIGLETRNGATTYRTRHRIEALTASTCRLSLHLRTIHHGRLARLVGVLGAPFIMPALKRMVRADLRELKAEAEASAASATSVPNPKFARFCGPLPANFGSD